MKNIKCPEVYKPKSIYEKSVFLGGGITNCSDWQAKMTKLLIGMDVVVINPRRDSYDNTNVNLAKEQITWEYNHLRESTALIFWFASETLCPITLFEYGFHLGQGVREIFLGIDPEYKRKIDLEIQTELVNKELKKRDAVSGQVTISYSIEDLADKVIHWVENS